MLQDFIGVIFGIPENVLRFLKNVFHIPDERQLGLASLVNVIFSTTKLTESWVFI